MPEALLTKKGYASMDAVFLLVGSSAKRRESFIPTRFEGKLDHIRKTHFKIGPNAWRG